jgi:gamma-glutamylaminecyclotransferase
MPAIFVYGTLMKQGCRSGALAGCEFLGPATTLPRYRLYDCGSYPGLVVEQAGEAIDGEVWRVDRERLTLLDQIEGVDEGLYERRGIALAFPDLSEPVEAYFYLQDVTNLAVVGRRWNNDSAAGRDDDAAS